MKVNFNACDNKLEFYCAECNRGSNIPNWVWEFQFCPYCGHKYNCEEVNNIREKIVDIFYKR